ncbi:MULTISPECIES: primary-amine oxidase [unclassified Mycolicibacterium]|uniref:primary-amine oxidase n=1 Tax=unclassified Mycolicibacterium TaxID=2636767 RepID=UPI0013056816|nr:MULTISPECIES: primary-amine oxidase [unclassified Mycolicibacterium]MUL82543.1 primary-amine oxidase [Mycolicibacterium sp. CBMA 329]MUL91325.1 primary-amine oxidase [Mycolicibacterium sp. CBMA 331]MUM03152.1 primary-amine oxidase [Mycolicibacterium sp. CBMA 334]MUM29650.1 primary-amine oxidase [Mycolicibacterium sp. CBMA 295]MUM41749.1 primary-amine oxidase [Mycolicibacterium sp. CBMA 247]
MDYPLDPLSADEFRAVAAILRREHGVGQGWRVAAVELVEPTKAELAVFDGGGKTPARRAAVICLDRSANATYKGVVSLTDDRVENFDHVPGVQANFTVDEFVECDELLRRHPDVIAALAKRGITDLDNVFMDTWTYGDAVAPPEYRDRRIGWSDTWYKQAAGANPYAHPVSGLHCVVDINTMEVLRVDDDGSSEKPDVMGEYVPHQIPERVRAASRREPLKPLHITQPDGPSFTLEGNLLQWQNWSLRVGFNHREGMTLHTVRYRDGEVNRSVAHRMSFAEMVVPYRDSSVDHYRRTAFDIGEWGLGFMTTSLELGCDCLGEIRYLDAVLHNSTGEPYTITNAICIHEEDNAVLWKHVDHDAGAEVRRMRRLTLSFHVTVANYEYLVYWRLYQDGNIECEVRATGIMVTTPVPAGQPHPNGTLVDERTYAPFHQHFLIARLDLDIDGTDNTVYMTESHAEPVGPDNPYALSLVVRNQALRTEREGRQDVNFATQRAWKVVNTNVVNGLGTHPSYKLVPTGAIPAMFDPSAPVLQRANVIGHTLWVTPNRPDERWPAGEFVNQSLTDTGLGEWTKANRSIDNTDVVLWYVFGIHHITRPEDWPVMPVDVVSFWLKPFGFFDRNPALDVAATPPDACAHGHAAAHTIS